jgi:hypothetical protein
MAIPQTTSKPQKAHIWRHDGMVRQVKNYSSNERTGLHDMRIPYITSGFVSLPISSNETTLKIPFILFKKFLDI